MKITSDKLFFALTFVFAAILYLAIYSFTVGQEPPVGDDSLAWALAAPPKILTEVDGGRYMVTNMLPQARQNPLPQKVFHTLTKGLEPLTAFKVFQTTTSLIVILLFGILIFSVGGRIAAGTGMFLLAFDPLEVLSFGPTISEPFLKIFTLVAVILLLRQQKLARAVGGLLTGLGFFLQINFLWYALVIALITIRHGRFAKAAIAPALAGFTLGIAPAAFTINWASLFSEVADHHFRMADGSLVIHYPLKDFVNLLMDKSQFYAGFFDSSQILAQRGWALGNISPSVFGYLAIAGFLAFLVPKIRAKMDPEIHRWCVTLALSLVLFFAAVWASTTQTLIHMQYLVGANWIIAGALALSVTALPRWLFALLIALPQVGLAAEWVRTYKEQGPMAIINSSLQTAVTQALAEYPEPIFAISYGDMGTYEFLSKGKIRPIHATELTEDPERFPDFITLLDHLLDDIKKGTMVVTLGDQYSSWYLSWGPIFPELIQHEAERRGISIRGETISLRPTQQVWIFTFSRLDEASAGR